MMKKEDNKSGIVSSLIYYLIARFTDLIIIDLGERRKLQKFNFSLFLFH